MKIITSGKRKTAIARAVLVEGSGKININGKDYKNLQMFDRLKIEEPLRIAENILKLTRQILVGLHNKPKEDYIPTCANCQIICGPTMKDKKESYDLLKNSGCIENGDL